MNVGSLVKKARTCPLAERGAEELLSYYEPRIRKIAVKLQRSGLREDYEELLQRGRLGVLRALKHVDLSRKGTNLSATVGFWIKREMLAGLAQNNPMTHLEGSFADNEEGDQTYHDDVADSQPSQEERLARSEEAKHLASVVASLPPKMKVVILCRFVEDMTLEETGRRLGVTRERVRQIEAGALRALRRMLKGTMAA